MGNYMSGTSNAEDTVSTMETAPLSTSQGDTSVSTMELQVPTDNSKVTVSKTESIVSEPLMDQSDPINYTPHLNVEIEDSESVISNPEQIDVNQLNLDAVSNSRQSSINCRSAFQALNLEEIPYWKNQCKIDINKTRYVWIYSSYRNNGWWFMSPDMNDHVERLYQQYLKGEDFSEFNHALVHGGDFKYNFEKMAQVNRNTSTNRTIRRLDIDKMLEIEQSSAQEFAKTDSIWLYKAGHQTYVPFMPNYQEEIEAAYQDFKENPGNEDYVRHSFKYVNGYDYQLNFVKMTQLNQCTGIRREILKMARSDLEKLNGHQASAGFGQTTTYKINKSEWIDSGISADAKNLEQEIQVLGSGNGTSAAETVPLNGVPATTASTLTWAELVEHGNQELKQA